MIINKQIFTLSIALLHTFAGAAVELPRPAQRGEGRGEGSCSDETPSYIAALAAYTEDKLLGESELARLVAACDQNTVANPFSREEAELDTEKWHAYETLQEWIEAGKLNAGQVCAWAKKTRAAQDKQHREREQTRGETALLWDPNPPHLVSVDGHDTCVVRSDGEPACWGANFKHSPLLKDSGPVKSVTIVESCYVFVRPDGTLAYRSIWGDVLFERMGVVKSVSLGARHACAIKEDDRLMCSKSIAIKPELQNTKILAVSSGNGFSCVITAAGEVDCFGATNSGALEVPRDLGIVRSIAVNQNSVCALKVDSSVRCWGRIKLEEWADGRLARSIAVGMNVAAAVLEDGSLKIWGYCGDGMCRPPEDLGPVREVALGFTHACAVLVDNTLRCWGGTNEDGQTTVDPELRVWSGDKR